MSQCFELSNHKDDTNGILSNPSGIQTLISPSMAPMNISYTTDEREPFDNDVKNTLERDLNSKLPVIGSPSNLRLTPWTTQPPTTRRLVYGITIQSLVYIHPVRRVVLPAPSGRNPISVAALLQVSWIRHRDIHLLTVGRYTYTSDQRFQSIHSPQTEDWMLQIRYPQRRDSGVYECQVSTTPPIGHSMYLSVVEYRKPIDQKSDTRQGMESNREVGVFPFHKQVKKGFGRVSHENNCSVTPGRVEYFY
uniref:Ig-like domain-containing protein n=1 Tax=Timema poppense TaxID=170557 RepID=A0A7R9H8C6_TIMPO|nr:unnamed protein product [Timema poppensis]